MNKWKKRSPTCQQQLTGSAVSFCPERKHTHIFACLCESLCEFGIGAFPWSWCWSPSCMHTAWWSICHTAGWFPWLMKPFLSLTMLERRFSMCSQRYWACCSLLLMFEDRCDVLWMALGFCLVFCGCTIWFSLQWTTLSWGDYYKLNLLMSCLFVFYAPDEVNTERDTLLTHSVWVIFIFSWLNWFNFLPTSKNNMDSNSLLCRRWQAAH